MCVCEDVRLLLKVHSADFHLCVYSSFTFPDGGHDSAHISIVLTQVKKQTHLSRRYLWSRLPRGQHAGCAQVLIQQECNAKHACGYHGDCQRFTLQRLYETEGIFSFVENTVQARACPAHPGFTALRVPFICSLTV